MNILSQEYLNQFKKDHQGELWEELEEQILKQQPNQHPISGEDFPELEPEEQVSLLEEAAYVIGTQKPMNTVLLHSFEVLVTSLSLPEQEKERLLRLPQEASIPSTKHLTG